MQCYTESDWNELAERFEGCESRLERSLLQTLRDDFLPEIPRLFQEKEKVAKYFPFLLSLQVFKSI